MSDRRWQYKVASVKTNALRQEKQDLHIEEALNRFALEGWELVTVNHGYGGRPRLYLRK